MNGKLSGTTVGFGLSVVLTSIMSMLLVFIKETHEGLLKWMAKATSHHWITHGVIVVALFIVIGLILSKLGGGKGIEMKTSALVGLIVAAVAISLLGISGFYLFED